MSERERATKFGVNKSIYDNTNFDYTLPRPPVLGEEDKTNFNSEWTNQSNQYQMDRQKYKSPSPKNLDERKPPFLSLSLKQDLAQSCLKWAHSLHNLLQDPDGVKLFLEFLESEGQQHADALHFWFACEGLKNHNQTEKIQKLVKLIYKTYFMKSALPINDDLRKQITKNLRLPQYLNPPITLFDEAQAQVENLINNTTYPNFLKSDMYLKYLRSVQNPSSGSDDLSSESGSSSSSTSNKELANLASGIGPLPTLHEDSELIMNPPVPLLLTPGTPIVGTGYQTPSGHIRLTKDYLLMSQKHRALDIRPKSEAYAGLYMYRSGAHAAYNSYNPVSRQDSEMQSLSSHSDARTESDNLSLAESFFDGRSSGRSSRHKASLEAKYARESAAINKETDMHHTFIPRTQRMSINTCIPMNLKEHAAILKEKLENVKREQETQELIDRKLKESESLGSLDNNNDNLPHINEIDEKIQFHDDNDQDILDEHVSRVFSDLTLAISPGMSSPRPLSPPKSRWAQSIGGPSTSYRQRRRDKDGFSTFSGDSGNVHDFVEVSEYKLAAMVKSKSMPDYPDDRYFMRGSTYRRSSSKKTLTDLTDSGVSVVSDTPPIALVLPKDNRVLTWLMESDKSGRGYYHTHSDLAAKHRTSSTTSPNTNKHRKNHGSRSSSLERNSTNIGQPAQPFIADSSVPPPPLPNTYIQLEEARRRLMEVEMRTKSRQRSSNKYYPDFSQSSQSTLKKSIKRPTINDDIITTTVVFSFCDEQFPYRTKIPGSQITLRQFKEYLPKKGNYRFFFKTICEELGSQVIHEEVSNDMEILPLWEGKIMAQVKPID